MGDLHRFDDLDEDYFYDRDQTPEQVAEDYTRDLWSHGLDKIAAAAWGAASAVMVFCAIIILGRLGLWLVEHFAGSLVSFILLGAGMGWVWKER